jgi:hypothetical protein
MKFEQFSKENKNLLVHIHIYIGYTFQDYFLPSHGNREALVLGKLPYTKSHITRLENNSSLVSSMLASTLKCQG